jgi:hypothetical protein
MTGQQAKRKGSGSTAKRAGTSRLDRGAKRVEKVHRAIAGFPLDVLERIRRLEKPVARVRKLQETSIHSTYEMVRGIQRELVLLARGTGKATAKKPAARRARTARPAKTVRSVAAAS